MPIIDSLLRQPETGDRVAGCRLPHDALVNSQVQALRNLRESYEHRLGRPFPVSFDKYTGETSETFREGLRQHPPQIMLTNYVMAELLLVRPEDRDSSIVWGVGAQFPGI